MRSVFEEVEGGVAEGIDIQLYYEVNPWVKLSIYNHSWDRIEIQVGPVLNCVEGEAYEQD